MKEIEGLIRDQFEQLKQLRELTELRRYSVDGEFIGYGKLVFKGQLEFYDYRLGAFFLKAYVLKGAQNHDSNHCVRLWVQSADDGELGGWGPWETKDEATKRLEKIQPFLEELTSFPTIEEFNEEIRESGLFICFE